MYKKCFLEWYTCVLHEPITHDVQGRQGMAKVDFWEKTTAARAFGRLH